MNIFYIFIIAFALWGFFLTLHIHKKKTEKRPFTCPLGADCHTVITSDFSSFLGIGLEIFGSMYYGLIALSYSAILLLPQLATPYTMFVLTGFTIGAFFFSLYLTFVQAFYIKSWCTWCLISAGISTLLFVLTLFAVIDSGVSFVPILEMLYTPILIMHLLGFALGVGGATISDLLFFKFLKDFRISEAESKILKIMSQIVWVGLLLVIISGVGLFMQDAEALSQSSKFLVKVSIVVIITLNGALLNLYVSPNLLKMSFVENGLNVFRTVRLRKISFAAGAVSFVSWYSAFFLGAIDSIPFSYQRLISIYILLIILAVIVSQIIERYYCAKASTKKVVSEII